MDRGDNATAASSMAKCFAGDVAVAQTANAVQIFGGSGYIRGFEVERLYRDAKICQIYEGTQQIQRTIIAREQWPSFGNPAARLAIQPEYHLGRAHKSQCDQKQRHDHHHVDHGHGIDRVDGANTAGKHVIK